MPSISKFLHTTISSLVLFSLTLSALPVPTITASAQEQDDGIVRDYNTETGKVSMISGANDEPITILSAMSTNISDEQRADALVQSFAPEFGITNPSADLQIMEQSQPDDSRVVTRYQQTYHDIPVMAGELIVIASEQGALYSMNGEVAQGLSLDTTPTITAEEAVAVARQGMVKWYEGQPTDYVTNEDTKLWIFDESLLKESIRPAMLVWRMEMMPADGSPIRELVLVDAKTGNVPLHFNQIDTGYSPQEEDPTATPTEEPTEEPIEATVTPIPSETPIPTESTEEFETTSTPESSPAEEPSDLSAQANIYYVDIINGSDNNTCTSVASPCQHIQQTVNKAADGDTIYIAGGTYDYIYSSLTTAVVLISDNDVLISGGWDSTFTNQNSISIIDGGAAHPGVRTGGTVNVIIENLVIQNSKAIGTGTTNGGGVYLSAGNLTIKNSAIINNYANNNGGGIYTNSGTLTIINSTIGGNTANSNGGAISLGGNAQIQNSTIAYNTANYAGGVVRNTGVTYSITNTISVHNPYTSGSGCTVPTANYSITECTIGTGSNNFSVDPQIDNALSGAMPVYNVMAGSPAIDAGTSTGCPATDQRGIPRPQGSACDIGAVERNNTTGTIAISSGSNQTSNLLTAFGSPLAALVKDQFDFPMQGVEVTFTAPASGASGTFANGTTTTTAITNASGIATSSIFTSNATAGIYSVGASVIGVVSTVQFGLENLTFSINAGSPQSANINTTFITPLSVLVKDALANPVEGTTVTFTAPVSGASGKFTDTNSNTTTAITNASGIATASTFTANSIGGPYMMTASLANNASVNFQMTNTGVQFVSPAGIDGTTCNSFLAPCRTINYAISKASANDIIFVASGVYTSTCSPSCYVITINKSLTISAGWNSSFDAQNGFSIVDGGGVRGGIFVTSGVTASINNFVIQNGTSGQGGGIRNTSAGLTVKNSTIKDSRSTQGGGGIYSTGNLILNNVTISNNTSSGSVSFQGGGIRQDSGSLTIENSTIANNKTGGSVGTGVTGGGIYDNTTGTITIKNSIIANNIAYSGGADCQGTINVSDHNLIGNTSGCVITSSTGDLFNTNPLLPPAIYGNLLPIMVGSPAIDAGSSCLPADERGLSRPQGSACDIGSYEKPTITGAAATITVITGSSQHVAPLLAFGSPLTVYIVDEDGDPISGSSVTFTAPGTGASAVFADSGTNSNTVNTNIYGLATSSNMTANSQTGSYVISAQTAALTPVNFNIANLVWYVAPTGNDNSNNCTTPEAPCAKISGVFAKSNLLAGDTIYVAQGTYTGSQSISGNINIFGGWDSTFTTQSGYSTLDGSGFTLSDSSNIKISHFEITNCSTGISVGGTSAIVTLDYMSIHNCSNYAIQNSANLTISNSVIYSNTNSFGGGGINSYNSSDTMIILNILNTAIYENVTTSSGGGVYIFGKQNVSIVNSTIYKNSSTYNGGGVYMSSTTEANKPIVKINNSTIAENTSLTSTVSQYGGGIGLSNGSLVIQNSIIANNKKHLIDSDCGLYSNANITSGGYNIFGALDNCSLTLTTGDQTIQPGGIFIPSLGYYLLSPSNPALNAGNPAPADGTGNHCAANDQRNLSRPQGGQCDIGAFEYPTSIGTAHTVYLVGEVNQNTISGRPFPELLKAFVSDSQGNPVSGATVTFTAPASGASGIFSNSSLPTTTTVTDSNGIATASLFTANNELGAFVIDATVSGATTLGSYSLNNGVWFVSPGGNDSNNCKTSSTACASINGVIAKNPSNKDVILVQEGTYTGAGTTLITITKSLSLSGGWNAGFSNQTGYSVIDGEYTRRGVIINASTVVAMERFEIINSYADSSWGAAILNNGVLTLTSSLIHNNYADNDGGGINSISSSSSLRIDDSQIFDNYAEQQGGGISSNGDITITHSAIYNNTTEKTFTGNAGGGVYIKGSAGQNGLISDSTISGNSSSQGGGILLLGNTGGGFSLNVKNSTITQNEGGLINQIGTITIQNSLIANNLAKDCSGSITSSGYNIITSTTGCTVIATSGDQFNIGMSGTFIPGVGYYVLPNGSPAIDAGNPVTCTSNDQRRLTRPQGSVCDIGAYEHPTSVGIPAYIIKVSGDYQNSKPSTALQNPFEVVILDANKTPVNGATITFTAPLSGPTGIFDNNNVSTSQSDGNGLATSENFVLNNLGGTFLITAAVNGVVDTANFSVNKSTYYIKSTGIGSDCSTPAKACSLISTALQKIKDTGTIFIAGGTYPTGIAITKNVTIIGGWDPNFTTQNQQTSLSGQNTGWIILVDTSGIADIENVNIVNGKGLRGAGISNSGDLTLKNVTVASNTATGNGGGIYQYFGTLNLSNVTISNNTAFHSGGGIYIEDGTANINNSTITQNVAFDPDVSSMGGGISNPNNVPVNIKNTIIAGNAADINPDCSGQITSVGNNLIGFVSSCEISAVSSDQIGNSSALNAQLGNLVDNGGTTLTHALLTDSPAFDAGNSSTCEGQDQRGVPRPQGSACDIGAFEGMVSQTVTPIIRTYNSQNLSYLPGVLVCDQTQINCSNGTNLHADRAQLFALGTYDLFLTQYNRRGIDNNNMPILSSVYYQPALVPYGNAFWTGSQMVYGNIGQLPFADDIVAHELTHGVTQYESNLFYFYQSGAINESFSDVFGEYYDQTNQSGTDTSTVKWLIGEDTVPGGAGAFRSMSNPTQFNDPDKMSSSFYIKTDEDGGGVHSNSGVNNKAVYLMVDGDTFNGIKVTGIGWDKTAAIYYEANTNLLSSGSDYSDLYYAIQQACITLSGTNDKGLTSADCVQVTKALDAVQMNSQPASKFNPDAAICPAGNSTGIALNIFDDNFENGTSKWYKINDWSLQNFYATSPSHMMYGDDDATDTTSVLQTNNNIVLPAGTSYLYFRHAFAFEYYSTSYYDGGVLEYTIDNGLTWKDAKPLFSDGKNYTGSVLSLGSTNSLKGRSAFVGDSHGYVSTRYNLSSIAGKAVKFRWVFATDQYYNYLGWFIDDVKIYSCEGSPSIPAYVAPTSNGLVTDYTPLLDWSNSTPNIHHYQVQIGTNSDFTSPVYDVNNLPTSQYIVPTDLNSNTTYYWRVRAFNTLNETKGWAATRIFRTALLVPALTPVVQPLVNNRPVLDWTDVLDTTNYTLQVSIASNFSSFIVNAKVDGSSYVPTKDLPANKTLYWRVSSNGTNGPSAWSATSSFSTANPPSVPVLSAPVDKSLSTDLTPKLDWANSTTPLLVPFHHYHVQIGTDAAFSNIVDEKDISDKSNSEYTPLVDLSSNTTYFWRVRSYSLVTPDVFSSWSLTRSFRTTLPTPTITAVTLPLKNNRPTFDWTDVAGATGYTIQISTVNTFASFVSKVNVVDSLYVPAADLPANKTLYWRVIANGVNGPSLPSAPLFFVTLNPPSIPVLSAPADNLLVTSASLLPPKLDWGNATVPAGVTFGGYQLQVATDAAFTSIVPGLDVLGLSASEFTISTPLMENTKYFWRVRSYDTANHNSSWSLVRSFRIAMPAPSTLALPTNDAVLQLNRPTFDWDDVAGATGYTIQVSTVNTFASFVLKASASSSTFVPTVDLPANKTLYWRVISNGPNGPSLPLPSVFSSFSTANPPSIPSLVTPADNLLITNTLLPKLDWNNSTVPVGVTLNGYEFQVATDATFTSLLPESGTVSSSEFTFNNPLSLNTKYFWRVRSLNTTSHPSSWSLTRSFRIALPAPTLVSPSGAQFTNLPTFDWDDVSGATGYTVQISTVSTFASFVLNKVVTDSVFIPSAPLPANKTLFWRVITNGSNGPSLPSVPSTFSTANPPSIPVLSAPADNLLIANTLNPKLDWNNATIPAGTTFDHYEVQLATDAVFSTGLLVPQNVNGITSSEFTLTSPLLPNTKYFWHVRSVNSLGQSSGWSLTRSFRIALPAPILVSPMGSLPTLNLRPAFDWDDVAGATYYSIQISTSSTFSTTLVNTTSPASTFTPSTALPTNTALYWRVLAQGPNGPGYWSAYSVFIIQ